MADQHAASTEDLLHEVLERLDDLSSRLRTIEQHIDKADFETEMEKAAAAGQEAALEGG